MRVRLAGLDGGSRVLAGMFAAVVLIGGVWLVWAAVCPDRLVAVGRELDRDQRNRAAAVLQREGIEVRRSDGALLVASGHLADAHRVLRSDLSAGAPGGRSLQQLADDSGLWRTNAGNQLRWRAGMMAELSRLVTEMEPVATASVLFEPGSARGLGTPAKQATAAVKVTLAEGRHMSPSLIVAIADLLCGSIAGLEISDVRIVDQTGRSYRASAGTLALAERHATETYYQDRILAALRYVPGISADVQIGDAVLKRPPAEQQNHPAGGRTVGVRVRISLPGGYLREAGGDKVAAAQLADIKRTVTAILPAGVGHDVTVAVRGSAGAPRTAALTPAGRVGWLIAVAGMLIALAGGALGVLLVRRCWKFWSAGRRRRRRDTAQTGDEPGYEMLLPFSDAGRDVSGEGLQGEHPQTLALILVRMSAVQAAEIMARLPAGLRAEVAGRMADLDDADPVVVSEIRRELAGRIDSEPGPSPQLPGEPESFHRRKAERSALRLPTFEDITYLSAAQLRAALGTVEPDDLAISLRTAGKQLKRRVLGCLATKDGNYVRTRMDRIGPMRLCDVESARQRVMQAVTQAAGEVPTSAERQTPQMQEGLG